MAGEVVADRCVVLSNAVERSDGAFELGRVGNSVVGFEFVQYFGVLVRVGQYDHVAPVFAALRTIAGMPMSMFSIASSSAVGFGSGASNG